MDTTRSPLAHCTWPALIATLGVLWPCSVSAQALVRSFDQIGTVIKAGDAVKVTDTGGRDVRGRIVAVEPASLLMNARGERLQLAKDDIYRVKLYYKDSGWEGAALGAAVGAVGLLGLVYAGDPEMATDPEARPGLIVIGAGGGALIGFIIDKIHWGQRTVYIRPPTARARPGLSVMPVLAPRTRAAVLVLSF